MKRIGRVVSGHHEFGPVSGGSDFPAGQMAALCGQRVWCVCVGMRGCEKRAGSSGGGGGGGPVVEGEIAHTLALCSVSVPRELLICSICGRGRRGRHNTCPAARATTVSGRYNCSSHLFSSLTDA